MGFEICSRLCLESFIHVTVLIRRHEPLQCQDKMTSERAILVLLSTYDVDVTFLLLGLLSKIVHRVHHYHFTHMLLEKTRAGNNAWYV